MPQSTDTRTKRFIFLREKFRVLCIDDDPATLQVFRNVFQEKFIFSVTCARTGDEAIRSLARQPYHVCVSDICGINFSGKNKWHLVEKYGMSIPIIYISGMATRDETAQAMALGAFWVFDKPVQFSGNGFDIRVKDAILSRIFIRQFGFMNHSACLILYNALKKNPKNVLEWAKLAGISQRQLLRNCPLSCPFTAADMLKTYKLLNAGINCWFGPSDENPAPELSRKNLEEYHDYYYSKRTAIENLISLSNCRKC